MHVGLIPDGTRGWAEAHGLELTSAYGATFARVAELTTHLLDRDAAAVSVFMLSRRNLERPPEQLEAIFRAESRFCNSLVALLTSRDARVLVAGRTVGRVSEEFSDALANLVEQTSGGRRPVYLCVAYDPFEEVVDAIERGGLVAADEFRRRLWVPEPIDLVVRSSGNARLSDFLPLQAAYAQLYFLPEPFLDITPGRIDEVLRDYSGQEIMYGR